MSKITMAAAFGAGYVVGAKAGRQRYEELSAKAKELWSNPKVQEQAGKVQEQAKKRVPGGSKTKSVDADSGVDGYTAETPFGLDGDNAVGEYQPPQEDFRG